jgi:AraC-like DNA-binding protein
MDNSIRVRASAALGGFGAIRAAKNAQAEVLGRAYIGSMATSIDLLDVSAPGLQAVRLASDEPYTGMKEHYAVARVESGHSEWWSRGQVWESGPGSLQIQQPGDVHRDVKREGRMIYQIVSFPIQTVESALGDQLHVLPQLAAGDERGAPFQRLHDAVQQRADRLTLEVAVVEAIAAFAAIDGVRASHTRAVRRAHEALRERLAEPITLDELAQHAGLDKFHLCRAFRSQVGMPPHAYLTRLRIMRAKQLLDAGVRPIEIAPLVGLYDQSQLNRHFRRLVGTTPGKYAEPKPKRFAGLRGIPSD